MTTSPSSAAALEGARPGREIADMAQHRPGGPVEVPTEGRGRNLKELDFRAAQDILEGCTTLATGGGGDPARGLALLRAEFDAGRKLHLVDLDELGDDALTCSPYFTGSIAPVSPEREARFAKLPKAGEPEAYLALRALERHLGEKFAATVSIEYGGLNTAVAMATAARAGIPVADADAAGRAVPDLEFSTYYVGGLRIDPLALATRFGETVVVERVVDDFRAEDLVRSLAVVSGGMIATVDHPSRGRQCKEGAVIRGALSYAERVGRAKREALEAGRDPVEAVRQAGHGYLIFEGTVAADPRWEDRGGFCYGETNITGTGVFKGNRYRIWFKNENIIGWRDGEVDVTVPDLICLVERTTARAVGNPWAKKGLEVAVLAFPAPKEWLTARGLEILAPRFFGFDFDPRPAAVGHGQGAVGHGRAAVGHGRAAGGHGKAAGPEGRPRA